MTKLRQVEVLSSQGRTVGGAVRAIGVAETTYHRERDQVGRLKELELENSRLRRGVSDLTLDKQILADALRGN